MAAFLPSHVQPLVNQILTQIAARSGQALGWGLLISILLGLWSANNGTKSLFKGLNIAYDQKEARGLIKLSAFTLRWTFGGIILVIFSAALIVAIPVAIMQFLFRKI